ncbi:IclR family transcriptional regulator domain-containing protein [Agrococcus casei]|uniref:IclR family transcriptional regulator domain-containing protein n=1 Tax=Agrococcus casei TaxID=343512 RepID=UPI003F8DEFF8
MSARLETALRVVRLLAARPDPTAPMRVGEIAAELSLGLSSASRLCSALDDAGLLQRCLDYGAYRLGPAAIALSGDAAHPVAPTVRLELTRVALHVGETVCLATPAGQSVHMTAVIDSQWTLHAPAEVGQEVTDTASAIMRAVRGEADAPTRFGACIESADGRQVEVATPVLSAAGDCVAVVAVRMPSYRAQRGVPLARRVLRMARDGLERALAVERGGAGALGGAAGAEGGADGGAAGAAPIEPALRVLRLVAGGVCSIADLAHAAGLRRDRVRRILDACRRVGLVEGGDEELRLSWSVHGWYRAALNSTLVREGEPLAADLATQHSACVYLTVLKGMRSFTLVEQLEGFGGGVLMRSWLARLHPIVGSDGGPTMLMDLDVDQLSAIFPNRYSEHERMGFLQQVETVTRDGVLTIESPDELGITSISAPVRDASGTVAAAACLVDATERVRPRRVELEHAVVQMAAALSAKLS